MTEMLDTASTVDKYAIIMKTHGLGDTMPKHLETFPGNLRRVCTKLSAYVHSEEVATYTGSDFEKIYRLVAADQEWYEKVEASAKAMCKPLLVKKAKAKAKP